MLDIENQLHRYSEAVDARYYSDHPDKGWAPADPQRQRRYRTPILIGASCVILTTIVLAMIRAGDSATTEVETANSDPPDSAAGSATTTQRPAASPAITDVVPPGKVAFSLHYPPNPNTPPTLAAGDLITVRGIGTDGQSTLHAEVLAVSEQVVTLLVAEHEASLLAEINPATIEIEILAAPVESDEECGRKILVVNAIGRPRVATIATELLEQARTTMAATNTEATAITIASPVTSAASGVEPESSAVLTSRPLCPATATVLKTLSIDETYPPGKWPAPFTTLTEAITYDVNMVDTLVVIGRDVPEEVADLLTADTAHSSQPPHHPPAPG